MRILITAAIIFFLAGCQESSTIKSNTTTGKDSVAVPPVVPDSVSLMELSEKLLEYIKAKNWTALVPYIHPEKGIRFSPYSFSDSSDGRHFTKAEFEQAATGNKKINWGNTFAEEEMIATLNGYADTFVYDVDFLKADQKLFNRSVSGGTAAMNNITALFPNADYTEFYFAGFDKKYEGMDWRALYLLFEKKDGGFYLTGVVHDQWTP